MGMCSAYLIRPQKKTRQRLRVVMQTFLYILGCMKLRRLFTNKTNL